MLLSYPLMTAIQEICARIGRVTGCGIAANLRKYYSRALLYAVLIAVSIANVFNLGADIGAMGAAINLLIPGSPGVFTVVFGMITLGAVVLIPYSKYTNYLKWLTLSLFSYVAVAFIVNVHWLAVLEATVIPHFHVTKEYLTALVAVFGTTISPYLFFWQSSQEVRGEESSCRKGTQSRSAAGPETVRSDTHRYLSGDGNLQPRCFFHHLDSCLYVACSRDYNHL